MIEIYLNGNLITTVCLINNLYYIKPIFPTVYNTEANTDLQRESKSIKTDSIDQTYMWHLKFGYIGLERINRLLKIVLEICPKVGLFCTIILCK